MSDFRFELLDRIGGDLVNIIEDRELYDDVMDIITLAMDGYDVTERCTELVTGDTSNEMLLKRYCACLLIDGKSKNTIYQYAKELQRFYLTIGKTFATVGTYDIRMYLAVLKQNGVSTQTLANSRSYIFSFFEWMVNEEMIEKNPCARIKPIKVNREIKKPFTDIEVDALRNGCRTSYERALIEVLLSSGVRRAELCDLKIGDVNFSDKSIIIRHGKGDKMRITYINDLAMLYLKRYLKDRGNPAPDEKLFIAQRGGSSFFSVRNSLHIIARRSGVDNVHPHRFRRTFATSLANRGMDIQEVQKLLGHSSINTTMQYVCVSDARVQNSYKKYAQSI